MVGSWRNAVANRWLLGLALCSFAGAACAVERVALQLRWQHQFQFAGYYVAQARGYYRDAGLDVEIRAGGPGALQAIDAVSSGRAEFGTTNSGLAAARLRGRPVVALAAVLQQSPSVWLVREGLDIDALSELARRPSARLADPLESVELLLPFARAGVNPATLTAQANAYSLEDFKSGKADLYSAYISNEPYELQQSGVGYKVLDPRNHDIDFYGEVLFTSERYASDKPSTVERFRAASLRGWQAAFEDVEGTARLIQERFAPQRSLGHLIYEGEHLRALSGYGKIELGHMSATRWQVIARQLQVLAPGLKPLEPEEFLFDRRQQVQRAAPDAVRIGLVGAMIAAVLSLIGLLRQNKRLVGDIERLHQQERERSSEELRFHFLMDVAPFPVAIFRLADGRLRYANERALAWMGLDLLADDSCIHAWLPQLDSDSVALRRLRQGQLIRDVEFELPASEPATPSRWCLLTVRSIEYEGGACGFATFSDISSRKHAEMDLRLLNEQRGRILAEVEQLQLKLREASLRDALTGLYNRRYLELTLQREWQRCRREGSQLALLLIDCDHFKRINDTHGHAAGDAVLRALGVCLASSHRASDVACRFGGEEFLVLLPDIDVDAALQRAHALRKRIESLLIQIDGGAISITVSIGVAIGNPDDFDEQALFRRADAAAYAAKRAGRNCVCLAPSAMAVSGASP